MASGNAVILAYVPVGSAPQLQPVLQYCLIRMASHTAECVARYWPINLATTDAFSGNGRGVDLNIDSNYVDGVSLTHGSNPRQHIWTFAAAVDESGNTLEIDLCVCPCSNSQLKSKHLLLRHLLDRTTFAIQEFKANFVSPGDRDIFHGDATPCGMGLGVALPAPAVPSTTLHGSTGSCHSPPLTT